MNTYHAYLVTTIDRKQAHFAMDLTITDGDVDPDERQVLFETGDSFDSDLNLSEDSSWISRLASAGTGKIMALLTEEGFRIIDPDDGTAVPVKEFFGRRFKWLRRIENAFVRQAAAESDSIKRGVL